MNLPILLDGAVGTGIWNKTEDKLPVWIYNITKPEVVRELAEEYIEAGSQIIMANTFGANRIAVKHDTEYSVEEVVTAAVRIAKEAAKGKDVKVALDAGPLTEMMEPFGELEEEEVAEIYDEMFAPAVKAGADCIMLETFIDLSMLVVAAKEAMKYNIPVMCSLSFEASGRTMFGNDIEQVIEELGVVGVDAIGLNCSLGPDQAVPLIREFAEKTDIPLIFKPNAGKPTLATDGSTTNPYTKEDFEREVKEILAIVSYIGGCCGTSPEYIAYLKENNY